MRDALLNFGIGKATTTATEASCPDTLQFFEGVQTVGMVKNVNLVARPSRDIAADEVVTVNLTTCDTENGTYVPVGTYTTTGEKLKKGFPIKMGFPRVTQQYLKASVKVTKGADAFVPCNLDVSIEQG